MGRAVNIISSNECIVRTVLMNVLFAVFFSNQYLRNYLSFE